MALVVHFRAGAAVQSVADFKYVMTICKKEAITHVTRQVIFTEAVKTDAPLFSHS